MPASTHECTTDRYAGSLCGVASTRKTGETNGNTSRVTALLQRACPQDVELERVDVADLLAMSNASQHFFQDFVSRRRPCILTGTADTFAALRSLGGRFAQHATLLDAVKGATQSGDQDGFSEKALLQSTAGLYVQVERRSTQTGAFGSGMERVDMLFSDFWDELKRGNTNLYLTTQYGRASSTQDDDLNTEFSEDVDIIPNDASSTDIAARILPKGKAPMTLQISNGLSDDDDDDDDDFDQLPLNVDDADFHDDFEDMSEEENAFGVDDMSNNSDLDQDNTNEEDDLLSYAQPPLSRLLGSFPVHPWILKTLSPQQVNLWVGTVAVEKPSDGIPSNASVLETIIAEDVKQSIMSFLMNGCGVSSGLHHDFADNLYVLLHGRKRFTMFPPSDAASLHLHGAMTTVHRNGMIRYKHDDDDIVRSDGARSLSVAESTFEMARNILEKCEEENLETILSDLCSLRCGVKIRVSGKQNSRLFVDAENFAEEYEHLPTALKSKCLHALRSIWELVMNTSSNILQNKTTESKGSVTNENVHEWEIKAISAEEQEEMWPDITELQLSKDVLKLITRQFEDMELVSGCPKFVDVTINNALPRMQSWIPSSEARANPSTILGYVSQQLEKNLKSDYNDDRVKIKKDSGKRETILDREPPSFSKVPSFLLQLDFRKCFIRHMLRGTRVRLPLRSTEERPESIINALHAILKLSHDEKLELDTILEADPSSTNEKMQLFTVIAERIPHFVGYNVVMDDIPKEKVCTGCMNCKQCESLFGFPIFNRQTAHLNAGELLYLPSSWFHEVTSFGKGTYVTQFTSTMFKEDSEDISVSKRRKISNGKKNLSYTDQLHMAFNYWMAPPTSANYDMPYIDQYWVNDFKDSVGKLLKEIMPNDQS